MLGARGGPPRLTGAIMVCVAALGPTVNGQESSRIPERITLSEALRLAEARNPTLRAIQFGEISAEADLQEARARPNPEFALEGEEYAAFSETRPSFWNGQAVIFRLEKEIETAGRRGHRIRAATAGVEAARSAIADAQRQLWLHVSEAYFRLAYLEADLAAVEAAESVFGQVLALTRARYEVGEAAGVELRRLEVEMAHISDETLSARLAVSEARVALLGLLGARDMARLVKAVDGLDPVGIHGPDGRLLAGPDGVAVPFETLFSIARNARPDLRTARLEVERASAEAARARAARFPNLTAAWGFRRDFGEPTMDFEIGIPLPLFGGLNAGGMLRATAERSRVVALEAVVETQVRVELHHAADAVRMNQERAGRLETRAVDSARLARDLTQRAYEIGESALIDFLDSQREFLVTDRLYRSVRFDLRISLVQLAVALGFHPAWKVPGPGGG